MNNTRTSGPRKSIMLAVMLVMLCVGGVCGYLLYQITSDDAAKAVAETEAPAAEKETQKTTEKLTEKATEKVTEEATEKETGQVTEKAAKASAAVVKETGKETETESEALEEKVIVKPEDQKKIDDLIAQIQEQKVGPAEKNGETWCVSIRNLATGASGSISGAKAMKSASVIKTYIMATVYDRIIYPKTPDRKIKSTVSEDELNRLLTDMITVSDNDASNRLIDLLGEGEKEKGLAAVNQFCEENGYKATHLGRKFLEQNPTGDNFTSTDDCMNLLSTIANGTCVNKEASEKMLNLLKQQQVRHKIPAGIVSQSAVVANKTGELYGEYGDVVQNDIAIVEDGGIHYVLCVMSNGLPGDGSSGMTTITEISSMVYMALALIA